MDYIFDLISQPFSTIPHHFDTSGVERYVAKGSPYHIAIHEVDVEDNADSYVDMHEHDFDEINIILGESLVYEFCIDLQKTIVQSPKVFVIPKNVKHSQKVLRGKGTFICVYMKKKE